MSRAGKFIPGGSGRKASGSLPKGNELGPIRVPDEQRPGEGPGGSSRKLFPKGGLRQPVPKKNRLPITMMSALVFGFIIWFAQYTLVSRPAQIRALQAEAAQQQAQQALAAAQAADKARTDAGAKVDAQKITVKIDSNPSGASVTRPAPSICSCASTVTVITSRRSPPSRASRLTSASSRWRNAPGRSPCRRRRMA
jgi:hypothetical protein